MIGSVLTTAYSLRLWWGLFATKRDVAEPATVDHRSGALVVAPIGVLAGVSVLLGLAAAPFASRLATATEALDPGADAHLTLWPGLHLPLLLSVAITVAGTGLAVLIWRAPWKRAPTPTAGEYVYARAYSGLLYGARRLTTVTQSGSLPVYVAVVIAVVVVVLGVGLAQGAGSGGDAVLADSAMQVVVVLIAVALSIAVVASRRRFVSGAAARRRRPGDDRPVPDVRRPRPRPHPVHDRDDGDRRLRPRPASPARRTSPATVVGTAVVAHRARRRGGRRRRLVRLRSPGASTGRPTCATAMEQLSLPAAGGRNVVNVAVIDFRGVDTMFEITVFGTAALGVANLVVGAVRPAEHAAVGRIGARVDGLRAGDEDDLPPDAAGRRCTWPCAATTRPAGGSPAG